MYMSAPSFTEVLLMCEVSVTRIIDEICFATEITFLYMLQFTGLSNDINIKRTFLLIETKYF